MRDLADKQLMSQRRELDIEETTKKVNTIGQSVLLTGINTKLCHLGVLCKLMFMPFVCVFRCGQDSCSSVDKILTACLTPNTCDSSVQYEMLIFFSQRSKNVEVGSLSLLVFASHDPKSFILLFFSSITSLV